MTAAKFTELFTAKYPNGRVYFDAKGVNFHPGTPNFGCMAYITGSKKSTAALLGLI